MKKKILIVENECIIAEDLKTTLIDFGYEIAGVATNAEEINQKLEQQEVDLIIFDIDINREIYYLDTSNKIRITYNIPVIYLTSSIEELESEEIRISNLYGYLLKPFDEKWLYNSIKIALLRDDLQKKIYSKKYDYLFYEIKNENRKLF